ncbi:hypothetical protein [Candidatus Similichlamydia epinepheli]|uniref:hypothetical protein n=1 Tax=Candidatus Similichlamydia epinepheli TaxID=1903953 RepID=UPI0013002A78|nr:hypothetical protein [Candidatus Similichlamydia epinepheli]
MKIKSSVLLLLVASLFASIASLRQSSVYSLTKADQMVISLTTKEMRCVQGAFISFRKNVWIRDVMNGILIHLASSLIDTLSQHAKLYLKKEQIKNERKLLNEEKNKLSMEMEEMKKLMQEKKRLDKIVPKYREF